MSGATLLLVLRLISACALLAFLGGIYYYMHKELELASRTVGDSDTDFGLVKVRFSDERTEKYPLRPITTIGRNVTNSIVINNNYTSASHAMFTRRGSQWWIEDLDSRNGTLLNDIPIADPAIVTPGDVVAIGDVIITLEA